MSESINDECGWNHESGWGGIIIHLACQSPHTYTRSFVRTGQVPTKRPFFRRWEVHRLFLVVFRPTSPPARLLTTWRRALQRGEGVVVVHWEKPFITQPGYFVSLNKFLPLKTQPQEEDFHLASACIKTLLICIFTHMVIRPDTHGNKSIKWITEILGSLKFSSSSVRLCQTKSQSL